MEKMIDFVASLIRNFPKYTSPMAITKKKPSTIVPMSRSTAVRTNKRVRCGYQDQLYRFVNKLLDIIIVSDRIWKKNGTNKGTFGIIIYGANQNMLLHNLAGKQRSLHKLVLSEYEYQSEWKSCFVFLRISMHWLSCHGMVRDIDMSIDRKPINDRAHKYK